MYSIKYIAMFLHYLCCLMFRYLLFRCGLGVRLLYKHNSQRVIYICIYIYRAIYVYQSMRFHCHPCIADVPLLVQPFRMGDQTLFKATRTLVKHSIPTCYSLHKL